MEFTYSCNWSTCTMNLQVVATGVGRLHACTRLGFGFRVHGSGFRVKGLGFRVLGPGLRVV